LEAAAEDADLIVESITENLDNKRDVFQRLDSAAKPTAILASNTSSLPITRLSEKTNNPERVLGSHFIQPAHIVPLVEVVKGLKTSDEAVKRTAEIWRSLGRVPVIINADIPGFIVNRIQHAMIREAVFLLGTGVASVEDIDLAVSLGLGPRLSISGPLEQRDINGLDMHYNVAKYLWNKLSDWEYPLDYVRKMVETGKLGLKSGQGYYDWTGKDPAEVRRVRDDILIELIAEVRDRRGAKGLL
jgi:3-hydroxybutyryl-CoA dehydrogenase